MLTVKVCNMQSPNGNDVPNQFIIEELENETRGLRSRYFQSYNSIIVKKTFGNNWKTYLDAEKWDYSKTTGKYRNQFLNETRKETEAKIRSGEYILTKLN